MAKKKQEAQPNRRRRRTIDQQIADMVAKIAALKDREARKQAKADPALRHASSAFRSIEKALAATSDANLRHHLLTARSTLAGLVGGGRRTAAVEAQNGRVDADALLSYVLNNPGRRGEQIGAAIGADAGTIRPVMKRLIADGKVRTQGQKRGMTYEAV